MNKLLQFVLIWACLLATLIVVAGIVALLKVESPVATGRPTHKIFLYLVNNQVNTEKVFQEQQQDGWRVISIQAPVPMGDTCAIPILMER